MSEISFSMKMDWLQCIGQSDEAIRGFKLNMLLYELLSLLYSRFVSEVRRPELVRSGRNITMQIIGYMTSHRKQHLEATDVAREFGYGREHFCRLFRKATGKTFKEFLTDLRLDDACRKLSGSSASIASIAREMRFPRYARAADGRATQIRHTRAGISRTIRKSKLTFNERRRKYDWACTNHPSYEN
ncbi:MAG: AraC family transcriptional regulator [Bifidobacterium sp.]|uniref:AraC family transcriptional regulator n=1 Tax=Bifidobacterium sp. TaxID=41200 RepID=UPI002846BFB9|nr:AraC family transcriptional regulator [Bifidobacterium sp.]MDR3887763.1 AraC family transcriptional regulator [Bifidobacterium sp.]